MPDVPLLDLFITIFIGMGPVKVLLGLDKYLTHERILVLEKVLGIMLAALAAQLVVDGLAQLGIISTIAH